MNIIGQQGIADMFGVSRETIDTWQQQGFPVAKRGGPGVPSEYDSASCIGWLVAREQARAQEARPEDRLAIARADKIEMENAERQSKLIPVLLYESTLTAIQAGAHRAWCETAAELAKSIPGKSTEEIETVCTEAFDAFLMRISNWRDIADIPGGVLGR